MSINFDIEARDINGNLHLELTGDFDGNSAWELVDAIKTHYAGNGLVLINTENIGEVMTFGREVLENLMTTNKIPKDKLIFEGAKGTEIGPDGWNQVMGVERNLCRCHGCGNNCDCSK